MKWKKKGVIFKPTSEFTWIKDRAIAPIVELVSEDLLRIYFSVRDLKGRSTPIFLETDPVAPEKIRKVYSDPILDFGPIGSFDDNGILCSSLVKIGTTRYMYYVGWNPRVTVSYHLSIGLAISEDDRPFRKFSAGPILDRSINEPFFNTAPFVIKDYHEWKMWYVSCTGWKIIDQWPEPLYNIKMATSNNGFHWERNGIIAIDNDEFAEAVGKPFVFKEDSIYKMFYSYRNSISYRTDPAKSYRLGYAESSDGIKWDRKDHLLNLPFSKNGWDSIMMEYASSYVHKGKRYLLYNGNGFGESGFGYAEMNYPSVF